MQMEASEAGAATLHMMLACYKKFIPFSEVRDNTPVRRGDTSVEQLCAAAEKYGMNTRTVDTFDPETLSGMTLPVVIRKPVGYMILRGFKGDRAYIYDSSRGEVIMTKDSLFDTCCGPVIEMVPGETFVPEGRPVSTFDVIKKRVKKYRKTNIRLYLSYMAAVLCTIAIMLLTRSIVDEVINGGNDEMAVPLLGAMAAVLLVLLVLKIRQTFTVNAESRINAGESGCNMFKTVLNLPILFFDTHSAGSISNRLISNSQIDQTFLSRGIKGLLSGMFAILYLVLLALYSPVIAAAIIVIEGVYTAVCAVIQAKAGAYTKSMAFAKSKVTSEVLNGASMIETIKTAGAERDFFISWGNNNDDYEKNYAASINLDALSFSVDAVHRVLSSGIMLFLGAYLMIRGELTLGTLTMLQSILKSMEKDLFGVIQVFELGQKLRTDIERTDDILERETNEDVPLNGEFCTLSGEIKLDNVSFQYSPTGRMVLQDICMDIKPGEMIALVGSSGGGKSTLLKLLSGVMNPTSGTIYYDGTDRNTIPTAILKESISVVDQECTLFCDSVSQNIKLWDTTLSDLTVLESAKEACIYEPVMKYHGGFDAPVLSGGRNFSGGEIQRLELARAFVKNPSVLLLDEFTSALDVATEEEVFESICKKDVTSVMVVHRRTAIMKCDRVFLLEDGRIVESGTPAQLLEKNGPFAKLMESCG